MNKIKILIGLAVALFVGVIYLTGWFLSTVPLGITIDSNSSILTDLVVTTSKDQHKKIHKLPYATRVKPGDYTITAWGNGSAITTKNITVSKGEKNIFSLLFEDSSGENFTKLFQDSGDAKIIPFQNLFPYETADYLISADDDGEKIIKITIAAKHRFTKPGDGASYIEERDIVVAGAKKWLADQALPKDITVAIKDL